MKIFKTVFFIIAIASLAGYFSYDYSINSPVDASDDSLKIFEIQKGENLKIIAQNLKKESLIHSETTFYLYSRYHEIDKKFMAGRFTLSPSMNIPEITEIITNSTQGSIIFTIQEGQTAKDIEKQLVALGLSKPNEFLAAVKNFDNYKNLDFLPARITPEIPIKLEGYLFPDTYFLSPSTYSHDSFIELLLKTFRQKALPEIEKSKPANRSIKDIITMASIIELEADGTEDAPIIAGILWKRLDNNWFLGADATSLYLRESKIVTAEILRESSPYNTRKFQKGLPPGPIGNPGLTSILAAVNPMETEYWYYLHAPNGETHYAKTDTEHNANRVKYLQ